MSNNSESNFSRFIAGKGFYVVLACCLVGAAGAAYLAVGNEIDSAQPQPQAVREQLQMPQWNNPDLEEATKSQPNVAVKQQQSSSRASSSSQETPPQSTAPQQTEAASQEKQEYVLPVNGELLVAFSGGELVKNETLGDWRTHNGVDISAEEGTPVSAMTDGIVMQARYDSLWGGVVEIQRDDGLTSLYCGLSREMSVEVGNNVAAGHIIGTVGTIPCESMGESHIHVQLSKDGVLIDPLG